jgi:hypothetical protein
MPTLWPPDDTPTDLRDAAARPAATPRNRHSLQPLVFRYLS